MDVSIGAKNGASAVPLMRDAIRAVPQLRPLCLTVKAMLKEAGVCERMCVYVCVCVGMCVYAIRAVPQLRPLCLTVKAMLREAGVCAYVCIYVCVFVWVCVYMRFGQCLSSGRCALL